MEIQDHSQTSCSPNQHFDGVAGKHRGLLPEEENLRFQQLVPREETQLYHELLPGRAAGQYQELIPDHETRQKLEHFPYGKTDKFLNQQKEKDTRQYQELLPSLATCQHHEQHNEQDSPQYLQQLHDGETQKYLQPDQIGAIQNYQELLPGVEARQYNELLPEEESRQYLDLLPDGDNKQSSEPQHAGKAMQYLELLPGEPLVPRERPSRENASIDGGSSPSWEPKKGQKQAVILVTNNVSDDRKFEIQSRTYDKLQQGEEMHAYRELQKQSSYEQQQCSKAELTGHVPVPAPSYSNAGFTNSPLPAFEYSHENVTSYSAAATKRDWSTPLSSACSDICSWIFCAGFFFPWCYVCHVSNQMQEHCCVGCCTPGALIALRTKIRTKENIRGSICHDTVLSTFCYSCSVMQLGREINAIKLRDGSL